MTLTAGTSIGVYEIVAALGAGGMGEVYRARDTKLQRDVALKILPEAFALDAQRIARFKREAQVLASLNHPNIGAIYGFEDGDGVHALVLELVDGPTLADQIAKGPLPPDEALPIAKQIADALEAAHDQGIIHRDLKPANIKVRADATVKVLDFGLAKLLDAENSRQDGYSPGVTNSPTITTPAMTHAGLILGTAAYMSPEQAKGKPIDKRSDIWAFGCVLYEMLAGARAFGGEDITDAIAAVVTRDPDWTRLPPLTPDSIRRLLRRCLTKSVQQRLRSIGDAALEIDDATQPVRDVSNAGAVVQPLKSPVARWVHPAVAGVILVAVAALAWTVGRRQVAEHFTSTAAVRLSVVPAEADAITVSNIDQDLAIAPDGTRIAYVGGNGTSLIIRNLDSTEAVRIDGAGLPHNPFFSPDGAWVGFVDGLSMIRKVSARGGTIETVCRISGPAVHAAWHGDTIAFAQNGRIYRVSAAAGIPEAITPPAEAEQPALFNPMFLPDGNAVLVGMSRTAATRDAGIGVVDLRTRTQKRIMSIAPSAGLRIVGLLARFIAPNRLIYRPATESGAKSAPALRVVGFDLSRLETVGAPIAIDEPVFITSGGYADFDLAQNGTLVYVASSARPNVRKLAWVNRDGREEPIDLPARAYTYPSFSPDGRQVAFDIRDQENDIWIWDLGRNTLRRLTFDPGFDQYAVWARDQQHIVHILVNRIFWQPPDGSGQPELLAQRQHLLAPYAFSKDDRQLVFREDFPETGHDLMMLSLDAGRKVEPLLQTRFNELNAEISPDGRWLAFESDESGPHEIYVRPFPDVNAGRWQVSTAGGRAPQWSRDGQELYFLGLDGAMMAARVELTKTFVSYAPTRLFEHRNYVGGAASIGRTYDVAPDGHRFLMIKPAPPPDIAVVLNWTEELKQRVPTR